MPLEDLIELGYQVYRVSEGNPPGDAVIGFGKQWTHFPGHTQEADIVLEAENYKKLYDKMTQALAYFSGNYANWASMTNVQKDAANRQAQRALANLVRYVRGDLSSEGD